MNFIALQTEQSLMSYSELTLGMIGLIPIHTFRNLGEAVQYYNNLYKKY
jgi:hypothetical protein